MGLLKHIGKKAGGRAKATMGYITASFCFLLIIGNVAAFIFFPRIASPIAVLLSNIITILLMLIAIKPLNALIQSDFEEKAQELLEKAKEEEAMREKIAKLENENRDLSSRLDTANQTAGIIPSMNYSFKVETMTYEKSGYIVKEEPLERFTKDPAYKIADKKGLGDRLSKWMDNLAHPGSKKILYIGKYYVRASIGIDFTKIKFSAAGDAVVFYGVRFTKLNDLAVNREDDDVYRCLLLNEDEFGTSINKSDVYRDFAEEYSRLRSEEADKALEGEVDRLCEHYTAVFRKNLSQRFPNVEFCDSIEDSTATWYSLKEHVQDKRVLSIASNMFLMADVMSGSLEAPAALPALGEKAI